MSHKVECDFEAGVYARNIRTNEAVALISKYKADDCFEDIWLVEGAEGNLYLEYQDNLVDPYKYS